MKVFYRRVMLLVTLAMMRTSTVLAQSGNEEELKTQFNGLSKFIVDVVTGPLAKILALVFLLAAIWTIVHKDYAAAVGCVLALLALVFLPQILSAFGG